MFPDTSLLERLQDNLGRDLGYFLPEIALCAGIVFILLGRILPRLQQLHMVPVASCFTAAAFAFVVVQWTALAGQTVSRMEVFSGLLVIDAFAVWFRGFLVLFAILSLSLSRLTHFPNRDDSADFSVLLLGGILGMMLMTSANHLLMLFLAVEMASLPSYMLAGFAKGPLSGRSAIRDQASEASLKYVVFGAAASGVMLYGISLLVGRFGTGYLPTLSLGIATSIHETGFDLGLAVSLFFLLVGFGYKLAAVPFHVWLPDVFEGASAEIGALLSVASKAAAIALTLRVLTSLQDAMQLAYPELGNVYLKTIGVGIAIVASLTATLGNLAALRQTNLKRLLAYSTIAHAGYMLMGVACFSRSAISAILFYLLAYLLMNLGAFAVVAIMRVQTGSEDISAYKGLIRRSPLLGVCFAIFLLSLLGLPPLAGFAGKFQIFQNIYLTANSQFAGPDRWIQSVYVGLLAVGVINTVISAGYYLALVRTIGLEDPPCDEKGNAVALNESFASHALLGPLAVGLVAAGIFWDPILNLITLAIQSIQLSSIS